MKKLLGSLLSASLALAASASAGPVEPAAGVDESTAVRVAAADLDCLAPVTLGNGSASAVESAKSQDTRLREYLELHAQAADDGRVLLPWSVPSASATH